MSGRTFYILDVFALEKFAGNQLAVFRHSGDLRDAQMQQIANEMHFSETTFILSEEPRNGGWDVRIFTPTAEIPFAGHPTLGTAYVIQREIIRQPVESLTLNLRVGPIPVSLFYENRRVAEIWMRQNAPIFGSIFQADILAPLLQLDKSDFDDRFPIQDVSTGTPAIIIPLKSLDSVRRASVDRRKYTEFIANLPAKVLLVFCPQTEDPSNQLHVRVFADYYGVPEDPATGSANGCLAGWLVQHRYFGADNFNLCVEQGIEMGRPSRLRLRAAKGGGGIEVNVGGNVIMIAKGEFV